MLAKNNANELVAEYVKIRDWMAGETKKFEEFLAPHKTRLNEIELKLMELLDQQGANSLKTLSGTAYKSTIVSPKITDREAYLDVVMDNYSTFGAGMLQLGSPKKEAIEEFMANNNGHLPAGVETTSITRVNVRRS
jgi:hypothetical protein